MGPIGASLQYCTEGVLYTENTSIPFPFKLNGIDRGDSFPFNFEPNLFPFGSKSKGKHHHDHIPFNLKVLNWKLSFWTSIWILVFSQYGGPWYASRTAEKMSQSNSCFRVDSELEENTRWPSERSTPLSIVGGQLDFELRNYVSISFHIERDMIVVRVFLSIFWTKWYSIWFRIERTTVNTIIPHSMWKEMET